MRLKLARQYDGSIVIFRAMRVSLAALGVPFFSAHAVEEALDVLDGSAPRAPREPHHLAARRERRVGRLLARARGEGGGGGRGRGVRAEVGARARARGEG